MTSTVWFDPAFLASIGRESRAPIAASPRTPTKSNTPTAPIPTRCRHARLQTQAGISVTLEVRDRVPLLYDDQHRPQVPMQAEHLARRPARRQERHYIPVQGSVEQLEAKDCPSAGANMSLA